MKELPLGLRRPGSLEDRLKAAAGGRPDDPELERKLEAVLAVLQDTSPAGYHWVLNAAAYRRPWRPARTGWTNVLDQLLHVGFGALLVLPVLLFRDSYLGPALLGLLAGGIREVEQYFTLDLRIEMFWDRVLDTSTFVLGAVLLYHFWP